MTIQSKVSIVAAIPLCTSLIAQVQQTATPSCS
jgi:hypothetical protein